MGSSNRVFLAAAVIQKQKKQIKLNKKGHRNITATNRKRRMVKIIIEEKKYLLLYIFK
jgi:hypothetical protein